MEALIFVLIVVFAVVNGKNSKEKTAQRRAAGLQNRLIAEAANRSNKPPRATQPAKAARVKKPRKPAPPAAIPTVPVETQDVQSMSAFTMAIPSEGDSYGDDEECLGGSMAHDHTEGESVQEHRHHVEALQQREADEALAAQAALDLANMNLQRLRQAVVMAEVLDRPKALRRRAG